MSYFDNSLLHWSQRGAGHRPGQDLPTCSSCLMVFSCWVWIFSCSRALDSSFQSLSFKPAMQFSAREGDPSSSCFWACSSSTSCFSCKVSCSFPYRDKVGRDPKSRDHTPAPPPPRDTSTTCGRVLSTVQCTSSPLPSPPGSRGPPSRPLWDTKGPSLGQLRQAGVGILWEATPLPLELDLKAQTGGVCPI